MSNARPTHLSNPINFDILAEFNEKNNTFCLTSTELLHELKSSAPKLSYLTTMEEIEQCLTAAKKAISAIHRILVCGKVDETFLLHILNESPTNIIVTYNPKDYSAKITYHKNAKNIMSVLLDENSNFFPLLANDYHIQNACPEMIIHLPEKSRLTLSRATSEHTLHAAMSVIKDKSFLLYVWSPANPLILSNAIPNEQKIIINEFTSKEALSALQGKNHLFYIHNPNPALLSDIQEGSRIIIGRYTSKEALSALPGKKYLFYIYNPHPALLSDIQEGSSISIGCNTSKEALRALSRKKYLFYIYNPHPALLSDIQEGSSIIIGRYTSKEALSALQGKRHIFHIHDPNPVLLNEIQAGSRIVIGRSTSKEALSALQKKGYISHQHGLDTNTQIIIPDNQPQLPAIPVVSNQSVSAALSHKPSSAATLASSARMFPTQPPSTSINTINPAIPNLINQNKKRPLNTEGLDFNAPAESKKEQPEHHAHEEEYGKHPNKRPKKQ